MQRYIAGTRNKGRQSRQVTKANCPLLPRPAARLGPMTLSMILADPVPPGPRPRPTLRQCRKARTTTEALHLWPIGWANSFGWKFPAAESSSKARVIAYRIKGFRRREWGSKQWTRCRRPASGGGARVPHVHRLRSIISALRRGKRGERIVDRIFHYPSIT